MNKGVAITTYMVDQTSVMLAPLPRNFAHDGLQDNIPLLPSPSFSFPIIKDTHASHPSAPLVSYPLNSKSIEPRSLNYSPPARGRAKPPRKPLKDSSDTKDMLPLEPRTRRQQTPGSDSAESHRQEVIHRGANLRALLREAKIPQSDSDESFCSGRRPSISVDIWQAAMISTPRDRLRNIEFPNWHVYGGTDSPFYQHLCGLSASTSSLSGKETGLSSSIPSSHDNSICDGSRSCSPPSEKLRNFDPTVLHRRPSLGANASELSPSSPDNGRYLLPSAGESQEVLKVPALTKAPRTSPSNVSLIARITNLHQNATKAHKNSKRRPNTATGTSESTSIAKASPKPGPHSRSTPCPQTAVGSSSMVPSLLITGTKVASAEPRVSNFNMYKRPATANCPGSTSESALSLSHEFVVGRFPTSNLSTAKNAISYVPSLSPIQGHMASVEPTPPPKLPANTDFQIVQEQASQIEPVTPAPMPLTLLTCAPVAQGYDPVLEMPQSAPTSLTSPLSPASKRNAFYAAPPLVVTSDRLTHMDAQRAHLDNPLRTPSEDFHSKSRYLTLSVSPRPTTSTFIPGQRILVNVRLSNKVKVRKYTSIYLMLVGSTTSDGELQSSAGAPHDFLRLNYMIYPNPSDEVRVMSHSGDLCEWHIELSIPAYANCSCQPGPLPVPSTGTHASGTVSYSLQLHADRKQLLSNQESLSVKLHVDTQGEARYQVTTQPFKTQGRKGRIPFAGGYLGAINELTLSHQVYYQSADRLRIGYQFELQLSSNTFLPTAIAEEVSRATKVEVHQLIKEQSKESGLKFTDHRSKVLVITSDEQGSPSKWIVKGFLELKAVSQQMKSMKAVVESTPRTPRRAETSAGARSILSSSHGSLSPPALHITHSLQQETERQARLTSSQLFLTATIEHCPAVFANTVEVSSLIGSELLSPCSLRKLGDEMMKRAVMAEKMKKVQEENFKNDK
ncbi:hypothetical protein PCANC_01920 [Puccinia coronata f. sp. avenae]|uniref:Uncharacterized protein n=1 Tax=Puccinia coronata f. sp. avenae TaxID=200324 RepID=A0A2N5TD73_9BASI|nr:hypothetical protein PCASD_12737 [Puccinia coronata f. sp. avenae]PLW57110.1 hypothetical protein PCANC_01920 [Puccinia coronata f. sp. avenae]